MALNHVYLPLNKSEMTRTSVCDFGDQYTTAVRRSYELLFIYYLYILYTMYYLLYTIYYLWLHPWLSISNVLVVALTYGSAELVGI